ncbi:MAG: hypothetical protein DMG26_21275, partial [Acidobacteria bacterium]
MFWLLLALIIATFSAHAVAYAQSIAAPGTADQPAAVASSQAPDHTAEVRQQVADAKSAGDNA